MIAVRWLVASSIRRPIPNWKSAAIEKPVKTPPSAEDWSSTKPKMKVV